MSRRAAPIREIARWLARGGLFALWALVGWGSLLILVTLANVASQGPRLALGRLIPGPGASMWSLVSFASVGLAFVAWVIVAGLVLAVRGVPRSGEPEPTEPGEAQSSVSAEPGVPRPASGDERE